MRVRIISRPTEASVDGLELSEFRLGQVYALPAELATLMIVEGWAEPLDGDAIPVLPEFRFNIVPMAPRPSRRQRFTVARLTPRLGVAADGKTRTRTRRK